VRDENRSGQSLPSIKPMPRLSPERLSLSTEREKLTKPEPKLASEHQLALTPASLRLLVCSRLFL